MALSTSTSTANPELDSMCFKSTSIKEAELFAVQQAQINYICANLVNNSTLNYNIYKTPEYLEFYERRISPNQVNKIAKDICKWAKINEIELNPDSTEDKQYIKEAIALTMRWMDEGIDRDISIQMACEQVLLGKEVEW